MHLGFRVWHQWAAGTVHDFHDDNHDDDNVTEHTAAIPDGEGRQPDGRKSVLAGSHSPWRAECPTGSASRHQRRSLGSAWGCRFHAGNDRRRCGELTVPAPIATVTAA